MFLCVSNFITWSPWWCEWAWSPCHLQQILLGNRCVVSKKEIMKNTWLLPGRMTSPNNFSQTLKWLLYSATITKAKIAAFWFRFDFTQAILILRLPPSIYPGSHLPVRSGCWLVLVWGRSNPSVLESIGQIQRRRIFSFILCTNQVHEHNRKAILTYYRVLT